MICSVDGCGRRVLARGWCDAHYQRWRNHGDVDAAVPIRGYVHEDGPVFCVCAYPDSDGVECLVCRRRCVKDLTPRAAAMLERGS